MQDSVTSSQQVLDNLKQEMFELADAGQKNTLAYVIAANEYHRLYTLCQKEQERKGTTSGMKTLTH